MLIDYLLIDAKGQLQGCLILVINIANYACLPKLVQIKDLLLIELFFSLILFACKGNEEENKDLCFHRTKLQQTLI